MNKILIVDDETSNINVLCGILRPTYDVIVAKNGVSAIEMAKRNLPSLILLDVVMPGMTGFDVISVLKDTELTQRIPVIFISGLDDSKSEEKGLLLGAVDYIVKPFRSSIVRARVRTHLQIVDYINTIERMCKIDALTNIANRRCLDSQLAVEWARAARDKLPLGFIMIDIDHFKKYNDTHGHPQGDTLLCAVAAALEKTLKRPSDLVARWGGEEFAVLLPESDLNGALNVAERLRADVEHLIVPCVDGTETRVTISLGANSIIPRDNISMEKFISAADDALYVAKTSGRNRVQAACDLDIE